MKVVRLRLKTFQEAKPDVEAAVRLRLEHVAPMAARLADDYAATITRLAAKHGIPASLALDILREASGEIMSAYRNAVTVEDDEASVAHEIFTATEASKA